MQARGHQGGEEFLRPSAARPKVAPPSPSLSEQVPLVTGGAPTADAVRALQRSAGNAAVTRAVQRSSQSGRIPEEPEEEAGPAAGSLRRSKAVRGRKRREKPRASIAPHAQLAQLWLEQNADPNQRQRPTTMLDIGALASAGPSGAQSGGALPPAPSTQGKGKGVALAPVTQNVTISSDGRTDEGFYPPGVVIEQEFEISEERLEEEDAQKNARYNDAIPDFLR